MPFLTDVLNTNVQCELLVHSVYVYSFIYSTDHYNEATRLWNETKTKTTSFKLFFIFLDIEMPSYVTQLCSVIEHNYICHLKLIKYLLCLFGVDLFLKNSFLVK